MGRDHQSAVTADVDPPDCARHFTGPEVLTLRVDGAQVPIRSKHKSTSIRMDCQAPRSLAPRQIDWLAIEGRVERLLPSFDSKSGLLCQGCLVIGGWVAAKLERAQIEAQRCLAPLLKSEIDNRAV